ncbi:MAG: TerD family protein [Fibrobacteres bacterium]|nr:TerD family protein [Fibrobacterota bacterium]
MAVNLKKGEKLSLSKSTSSLSKITIGLGWDIAPRKVGFLQKLFGGAPEDYDLDAVAFLLGANGKVNNLGDRSTLKGSDVVFFNHMHHPSGKIWLTGDNRTGAGEGDDEQIIVNLAEMPAQYEKIAIAVFIYQGRSKAQTFSGVQNAFVRAVDAGNVELARFSLSASPETADKCSLLFAEIVRNGSEWEFQANGQAYSSDNIIDLLQRYI